MAVLPRELADDDLPMLSAREFDLLLEDRCRKWLEMTLTEFLEARRTGTLPDTPAASHLALLADARAR